MRARGKDGELSDVKAPGREGPVFYLSANGAPDSKLPSVGADRSRHDEINDYLWLSPLCSGHLPQVPPNFSFRPFPPPFFDDERAVVFAIYLA